MECQLFQGTPTNQSITSHKLHGHGLLRILPNGTASGVTAPDDARPASARQYNEQEELRPARYREKADVHFGASAAIMEPVVNKIQGLLG